MFSRRILAVAVAAALVTGCGLIDRPAPDHTSGGGNPAPPADAGSPAPPPKKKYSWTLPVGDVSPNYQEEAVYTIVRQGKCDEAARELERDNLGGGVRNWQNFDSPRNVLLAQAAIEFCRGKTDAGTDWFRRAERLGWQGLLHDDPKNHAACEFYKSAASVIYQQPRSTFSCPKGSPPPWDSDTAAARTDPRQ